jgi:hypothetical protein
MNRTLTLTTLALALSVATAQAAAPRAERQASPRAQTAVVAPVIAPLDGARIRFESEAQFQRDYGTQAERLAPGVYLMNEGPFAGKTVSMGISGLHHDLAVLQRRMREGGLKPAERRELRKRIGELQTLARDQQSHQARGGILPKAQNAIGISCWSYDFQQRRYVSYWGYAEAIVTGGLYMDRGDGTFNWYYSRMYAVAVINAHPPFGVWGNSLFNASASVTNNALVTPQTVTATPQYSGTGAGAGTGWVYNGPSFVHNFSGTATASASGDCWGYLSVSDTFVM